MAKEGVGEWRGQNFKEKSKHLKEALSIFSREK